MSARLGRNERIGKSNVKSRKPDHYSYWGAELVGCEEDVAEKGKSSSESPTEMEQGCVLAWRAEEREGWSLPPEQSTLSTRALPATYLVLCAVNTMWGRESGHWDHETIVWLPGLQMSSAVNISEMHS